MLTRFDEQSQKAIVIAESLAFDFGHPNVGSEHLLLSLLKTECQLKELLKEEQVNDILIEEDIKRLFGVNDEQIYYLEYSESMKTILEKSMEIAKSHEQNQVTLNILSIAMLQTKESVSQELLKKYHIDIDEIIYNLQEKTAYETKLDQYDSLINLNKKVKKYQYKIIGREKEVDQMITILSKREKSNVLIIGEAGVGKSALVEKLAMMINNKDVPPTLQHKIIYELSLASLIAGTKYRGEFEEKLKKMIKQIQQMNNVIIFVDEIHNLIGAGGAEGAIDASNILKPYLARKEMTMIGATTIEEYYMHFEKDQAMNRRFSLLTLKENTPQETYQILLGIKEYYENYHHIKIENQILKQLIDLINQYMKNRTFPDKAIDVLDLACVKAKRKNQKQLTYDCLINTLEEYLSISIDHKIDQEKLFNKMKEKILGQDQALKTIIQSPCSSYLFYGPPSVGKTTVAKTLAKELDYHFIILDLSKYSEPSSISKILGAPPGYVGYEQTSLLLSTLQSYPRSLLLIKNFSKAHIDIQQLFIQALEDQYIEDNKKKKVYFQNAIFIFIQSSNSYKSLGFKKQNLTKPIDLLDSHVDCCVKFQTLNINTKKEIIKNLYHYNDIDIQDIDLKQLIKEYRIKKTCQI